jgi:nucleotide-binding universal stress UspA family protein
MSVIVGYVPTKEGRAALAYAVRECRLRDSDLIVVPAPRRGESQDADFGVDMDGVREELAALGRSVEIRNSAPGNEPADDLIEAASGGVADLIVIGLRRRTPIGKLILGSNAQRILLDAPCPVIAVKADG